LEKKQSKPVKSKTSATTPKKTKAAKEQKEIKKLKEKLAECEQLLFDSSQKHLRLAAEFDNYRKRTQKELADIIEYAGEKVLRNIIPIVDDFERALVSHEGEKPSGNTLQQGLEMIYKKFTKSLADMDVKAIEAVDQPFNPDLHHAVMAKEVEGVEPDMVIEEFEKGYLYKKHVLRHAKVVVSK
jgi:molecular chaperone GrpE